MTYITKDKSTMFKDERNKITLDKDLFAFASDFSDAYFANNLTWKKTAIHFKHTTSNQKKIIVLFSDSNEGWFEASALARTGSWQIDKIQIFDKDGDMETVQRADMPTPANFDIETIRKIAPSETIVAINEGPQKLVLGSGKGALYEPGFKVRLWNNTLLNFHDSTVYTINTINGDELELNSPVANYLNAGGTTVYSQSGTVNGGAPMPDGSMYMQGTVYEINNQVVSNLVENELYNFTLNLSMPTISAGQTNEISWYIRIEDSNDTNMLVLSGSGDTFSDSYNSSSFSDSFTIPVGGLVGANRIVFGLYTGSMNDGSLPINFALTISNTSGSTLKDLSLRFPNFTNASGRQKGIYQFIGPTF